VRTSEASEEDHGACLVCGRPAKGTRCTVHRKAVERERDRRRGSPTARGYGPTYQRLRRQVLAEERSCWLCGPPARLGDPLTVDHILTLALGGVNTRGDLHAAHLSCNSRRGAAARWSA
jgi:5-methylcytosine-specific restriction endonuclease McrA